MADRRTFFKQLAGVVAGFTVAGKLKAQEEKKLATNYTRKFKENSVTPTKEWSGIACSGVYMVTGSFVAPYACSGVFVPRASQSRPHEEEQETDSSW